jgi:hypothetical protein
MDRQAYDMGKPEGMTSFCHLNLALLSQFSWAQGAVAGMDQGQLDLPTWHYYRIDFAWCCTLIDGGGHIQPPLQIPDD